MTLPTSTPATANTDEITEPAPLVAGLSIEVGVCVWPKRNVLSWRGLANSAGEPIVLPPKKKNQPQKPAVALTFYPCVPLLEAMMRPTKSDPTGI